MIITQATKKDLSQILELQYRAYESEAIRYNDFTIPPMTQSLAQIEEEANYSVIIKATIDETVVGSVRAKANNNSCEIGRLIVDPTFQGQGIGTKLLLKIEEYFPNISYFNLFTGTESKDNIRLYKKNGYIEYKTEILNDRISLIFLQKKHNPSMP